MRKLSFLSSEGLEPINIYESNYWKKFIKSNLKVGVEIECSFEDRSPRSELSRALSPSSNYSNFGDSGVNEVKGDGSLVNGVEITTVGRRVSFLELYFQYKFITDNIMQHSPALGSHEGLHNHLLLDYGHSHNSLELSFNDIILKNFIQLVKRHFPELAYLTSTVKPTDRTDENVITRNNSFCQQDTLFNTTVVGKTMKEIRDRVMSGGRYKAVNLNPMQFDRNGRIERMHFELRFPDGSIFPAQIAAQNILYTALLLKAVELSEVGLISTGDDWERTKVLSGYIRNNGVHDYLNRCSHPLTDELEEEIRDRAMDMLMFLKSSIYSIEPKVYPILKLLAEKPISLRRRENTDEEINEFFDGIIKSSFKDNSDNEIVKLIATCEITDANSRENWCFKAAEKLNRKYSDVLESVKSMETLRNLKYDYELKSIVQI